MKNRPTYRMIVAAILLTGIWISGAPAEILFIDSRTGSDENPGTRTQPLQTIAAAAEQVNRSTAPGSTQIILEPGIYNLGRAVLFKNSRPYTEQDRLTITASILPDDPNWLPKYMPVILSTEPPSKTPQDTFQYSAEKCTFGLKMEISHVTIRGLKFLGNPAEHTWHYPIWRETEDLTDLLVTQCLFVGDKHAVPYLSPICAKGHKIVADHCIFYNCHTPLILWDAEGGISKECAVRYCIIDGARIAAVWTTQTGNDFRFHHNLIARSNYLWMRPRSNRHTYRIADCVITECKYNSGYGTAFELFGQTGPEIQYTEENVIREGRVRLEGFDEVFDTGTLSAQNRPRDYLHPIPGSAGYELGAGLFTKTQNNK